MKVVYVDLVKEVRVNSSAQVSELREIRIAKCVRYVSFH